VTPPVSSTARRPLDSTATGIMLLLCVCWAFQQIAIKLVAADISPTLQIGLRSLFAAVVLGLFVWRREGMARDGTLAAGLLAGGLFAAEFLLVALALHATTASHVVVFLYTAPIFTALGLHLCRPEERLLPLQWLGIVVAFAGIALAFLGKRDTTLADAPDMLLGDLLAVLAGMAWGATTVAVRGSALSDASPAKTLFYQMAMGAAVLIAWHALSAEPPAVWSGAALGSLAFQSVVVALASYLAWFWLLRRYLATRLSVLSFATPLFGVAFGVLFLHEPIAPGFAAGAALVLVGILLVSGAGLLGEKRRRDIR